jgi:uncharacterized protein (TIGR00369 family)
MTAAHAPRYGIVPKEVLRSATGLAVLQGIAAGTLPQPPIGEILGLRLVQARDGFVVFEGVPQAAHYNSLGGVHGGFAATLLDSAAGCAIFSTLGEGESWTTLELKLNFVRPMTELTGLVRAEGSVIHRGRRVATSEAALKDLAGKLYAHGTTTCMIFPQVPGLRSGQ